MFKNLLILAGLILLLYACTPVHAQTTPPTQEEIAACYDRINAAARDQWAQMNRAQRLMVGLRAIDACEGN